MSKYLVTGGAGFIGSNIVRELVGLGHEVVIVDDYSTGSMSNLAGLLDKVRIIEGNICSKYIVRTALDGVDYVLHQAALPSIARSVADPIATNCVQVDGTVNLLWAACQAGVKRVVFAGSSSIYGDSETLPKLETMMPEPKSPYAVSKLASEYYCKVFHQIYDLETTVLRYFNVFGPYQNFASHYSAVVPLFINAARSGEEVVIYGDGEQSRDFTYVSNVVDANLKAVLSEAAVGRTMNVACGVRTSLLEMLGMVEEILGCSIPRRHLPARVGDVLHSQADISKARELIGYEPTVNLRQGLERTIEFFAAQGKVPGF